MSDNTKITRALLEAQGFSKKQIDYLLPEQDEMPPGFSKTPANDPVIGLHGFRDSDDYTSNNILKLVTAYRELSEACYKPLSDRQIATKNRLLRLIGKIVNQYIGDKTDVD